MSETKYPIDIVCDVIQQELGLEDTQVMEYNEEFMIPTVPGIFIVASIVNDKILAVENSLDADGNEVQEVAMMSMIQIDIMSKNQEARERRIEVVAALGSMYAQEQYINNSMKVGRIPADFVDTSALEESARMNRYTATVTVNSLYRKTKDGAYYNVIQAPAQWIETKPQED